MAPPLGSFGDEAGPIIDQFIAAMGAPAMTEQQVVALLNDPSSSDEMMGTLLPFVYTDLENILNTPQGSWTQSQASFVAAVQTYIEQQRQAAARAAEADYEAWAKQTVGRRTSTNRRVGRRRRHHDHRSTSNDVDHVEYTAGPARRFPE